MLVEALLVVLVLVVAFLMALDLARTPSEMPLRQAGRQAHDAERDFIPEPGSISAGGFGHPTCLNTGGSGTLPPVQP